MLRYYIIFLFFISNIHLIAVQENYLEDELKTNDSSGVNSNNIASDALFVFTSPKHFNSNDWLKAGVVLSATAISFFVDDQIRTWIQNKKSNDSNLLLDGAEIYGSGYPALIVGGALYFGGGFFKNEKIKEIGGLVSEAIIITAAVTLILKFAIGRSRPYMNEGPHSFMGFQLDSDYQSLPSGHTSVAFAISSVLSRKINNTYASIFLYSLAGMTAFQRIYSDNHWFSDTLLGAAIGYFIGHTIADLHEEGNDNDESSTKLNISPFYVKAGVGVSLTLSF